MLWMEPADPGKQALGSLRQQVAWMKAGNGERVPYARGCVCSALSKATASWNPGIEVVSPGIVYAGVDV